jgi:hypothetical protein
MTSSGPAQTQEAARWPLLVRLTAPPSLVAIADQVIETRADDPELEGGQS